MNLESVWELQKAFVKSGQGKDPDFRITQLLKLKNALKQNEDEFCDAVYADFKKSKFETLMTEFSFIYGEINECVKKLKRWSRPKKVSTGLASLPGKSLILQEPYGSVLIIGAWNYPLQLSLIPLISAMAAGNACVLKPSELALNSANVLARILNQTFSPDSVFVAEGGVETSQTLLKLKFDKIFFTGSTEVGKIVARAAAENLTPVTLELGGKSPCIVMNDADLKLSAKRIAWGKCLNAGQTCIAPDYVLIEKPIYESFLIELKEQLKVMTGEDPLTSESYARIINRKHFARLSALIDKDKVVAGGQTIESENFIEPTLLRDVELHDAVMNEEIFGPILPTLAVDSLDHALAIIEAKPKPLAFYFFGGTKEQKVHALNRTSFGGATINDVMGHFTNPNLPFGGVGPSGMGCYHGEAGFKAFSHFKSVMVKPFWGESSIRYAPYTNWKKKLIQFFTS